MSSTVPPDRSDLRDVVTSVPTWLRVGIAVVGALVLAIGAVAVFRTTNGNGSAALVAAGLALIVLAVLTERLQSIEAAGLKLQLSTAMAEAEAEDAEQAAEHADDAGKPDEAQRLRSQADALRRTARITGAAYEGLRARQRPGWDHTGPP